MHQDNNQFIKKLFEEEKQEAIQAQEDEIKEIYGEPTKWWSLGGVDEIGKNMYVFQQDDEIYIIDCGIKFADNEYPGVNGLICPFDSLIENQDKVKALIITHGHEDHIGGVPYLLSQVHIPKIYGPQLALELIKKRAREFPDVKLPELSLIDDNTKIITPRFKFEFYRVCHSIPHAFGVYIETKNAKIIHSGDFKFDFSTNGDEFDILKVAEMGRRNIDVLFCESTNAETPGFAPSEKYVIEELRNLIENCPGRVFVATFASNLQRIEEIIEIGLRNKRKICLYGRSMNDNVRIAMEIGLLNVSKEEFIDSDELSQYQDNEIMIICTGSQGEEMAALNNMANGKNKNITFKPTDTVLLSSSPIPGNFEAVERLVNKLFMAGVNVKTNSKETKLHTSGHATQMEQQLLMKLTNPQYVVPIHGEYKMLRALKQNAVDAGIHPDNVTQVARGQILEIYNHRLIETQNFVEMYDVFVNNNKIDTDSTSTLKYRKALSHDGIFNVTILINTKTRKVASLPTINSKGSFFVKESQPLLSKIAYTIRDKVNNLLAKSNGINRNAIRKIIQSTSLFYVWSSKKKKPYVFTTIFEIND
ncbi:MAG: ribonuclease J [Mycoplasma sp.]